MITIQLSCTRSVQCNPGCMGGLAYNGSYYVAANPREHSVTKLDENLCLLGTIPTTRAYHVLCYDQPRNCWWAGAGESASVLYRLDEEFREVGTLRVTGACRQRLRGLSCDPCSGELWLVFAGAVERVDQDTGAVCHHASSTCNSLNMGILALCGGYALAHQANGCQNMTVECPCCGERETLAFPKNCLIKAMVLCAARGSDDGCCMEYEVGLLLAKCGCRELEWAQCQICCCRGAVPPCPCPPCPPDPPCPCPPCPPEPPCPCPPCPCPPCPHPPCPHPPCPPDPPCPQPWPPCTPCLPLCCGAYEVMHSVALEEAGIAHILNAEGEKLQKAVATSTSIDELLCINESVRKTITQITLLEGQLYSKLETISGGCLTPCDET